MPALSKNTNPEVKISCGKKKRRIIIQPRKKTACLPCHERRVRCIGEGTPCGTCTARGIEKACEFPPKQTKYSHKMASHMISTARDVNGPPSIPNEPSDTTGSPSTASTVTALSELGQTPSVNFSDSDSDSEENIDANQTPDGVTFERPLDALPSWEMIDKLKARFFAFIFPLFCSFSFVQFEEEYISFRQNPDEAPLSWLSLLFAILALACRAELVPERALLFDRLSMTYEKAAWDCLSLNNPPFEPSTAALKALILVIYGRVHRGTDVSRDLHTAYKMATSTSYHRPSTQSMTCEENKTLWIALKMLLFMNGQLHSDPCDQEVSQNLYLMAGIDWKESLEMQHLPMSFEDSSLSVMDFTVLQSRVLTISDIIDASKKYGFLSSWSLPGVVSELSRIENDCNQFYAGPCSSDSQGELCKVRLGILRYCIQYLLQSAHFPSFESYLDGDITSDTQSAAEKCIDSATCALGIFCSLVEGEHFQGYSWYMRGLGKHYASNCMKTLKRGLETICTGERAQEATYYTDKVAEKFSTLEKCFTVPSSGE